MHASAVVSTVDDAMAPSSLLSHRTRAEKQKHPGLLLCRPSNMVGWELVSCKTNNTRTLAIIVAASFLVTSLGGRGLLAMMHACQPLICNKRQVENHSSAFWLSCSAQRLRNCSRASRLFGLAVEELAHALGTNWTL